MDNKKILVVGSLNMDLVVGMEKMPQVGETVLGKNINYIPGGKGANQACAIARLGGDVTMLGRVGDDEFADILTDSLSETGVDIRHIRKVANMNSGIASIYVDSEADNTIVVMSGANNYCDLDYVKANKSIIQENDIILLQMEIPMESIKFVIDYSASLGKTIILNPAPATQNLNTSLLNKVDYLTPNETELEILSGIKIKTLDDVMKAGKLILEMGTKNIIVTMGDKGSMFISTNRFEHFPAKKVEAIDTTAAGDTFNGAIAVYLAEGKTIEEAISFANTASSVTVTRIGAQTSIPTRLEIDAKL